MNVPVIVGVGRTTQRPQVACLESALDTVELAQIATEVALSDAQLGASDIDAVVFVQTLASNQLMAKGIKKPLYDNPALSLAKKLDIPSARCFQSEIGGNMPQTMVNICAEKIVNGEFSSALITGAEALDTLKKGLKKKYKLDPSKKTSGSEKVLHWGDITGKKAEMLGSPVKFLSIQDLLHDTTAMPVSYSLIEQAVRLSDGVSAEERAAGNGRMFNGFSKVSAYKENEKYSWFPKERSAEEIATVGADNRIVAYPYTKLNCAIMDVNQAASVIMMSEARALSLGIPREKMVYLHGSADCNDVAENVTAKPQVDRCPGMKIVGDACFENAGVKATDISFFDIYSCFPVAVRLACREMGLPVDCEADGERLTLTGGLPFHGGPGNNYVAHSLVAMVEKLRANPGKFGLVTANGGILSKHSAGIYSTTPWTATHPGESKWVRPDCKPMLEAARRATPPRKVARNPGECDGVISYYSIMCDAKSRPTSVTAIGDITSGDFAGQRFVAKAEDEQVVGDFFKNKDSMANTPVRLSTMDLNGKGKIFKTFFTPLPAGKL